MDLQKMQIEDWAEFIEKNGIDLSCPTCHGEEHVTIWKRGAITTHEDKSDESGWTEEKQDCGDCGGQAYIEPMWNTIWNSGFHNTGRYNKSLPWECGCVFAFLYEDEIYLGLSGCGMDMSPHLCEAWMTFFPECQWIPEEFMVEGCNLTHAPSYVESCVGDKWAAKIFKLQAATYKATVASARRKLQDVKTARKNLYARRKAQRAAR